MSAEEEVVVTFTGKGADVRPLDYLTHADGIRVLSGDDHHTFIIILLMRLLLSLE